MADHALTVDLSAPEPDLPDFAYARAVGPLDEPVRLGYSCEHRLDEGPLQMRPGTIHDIQFDHEENRCRACVAGSCVQRVELWPDVVVLVVHDCRAELS